MKGYNTHALTTFFRDFMLAENISRSTVHNYTSDLVHFMGWVSLNSDFSFSADNTFSEYIYRNLAALIAQYKAYLLQRGTVISTLSRKLYCLRKFSSACRDMNIISDDTHINIVKLTERKLPAQTMKQLISEYQNAIKTTKNSYDRLVLNELQSISH